MEIITWDDINNFREAVREMNAALGIFPVVLIADKRGNEIEPAVTMNGLDKFINTGYSKLNAAN